MGFKYNSMSVGKGSLNDGGYGGDGKKGGRSDGLELACLCSICRNPVMEERGNRSTARLACGHLFHLDCIGSSFNARRRMQCPNCFKVEDGKWRYAAQSVQPR
ncbi:hypothetical protein ZOSMA_401G00080 [Zostera marina]|uniref:RING-type domain-containing protein n=1 Tax=Zostera marina TaxID=29655 RepID=A0A0K9P3D4_ZOSMR|nr:hypothetical protein ZOSMA_401G00080 [Zostera marina]